MIKVALSDFCQDFPQIDKVISSRIKIPDAKLASLDEKYYGILFIFGYLSFALSGVIISVEHIISIYFEEICDVKEQRMITEVNDNESKTDFGVMTDLH